jgi:hypothetical protein
MHWPKDTVHFVLHASLEQREKPALNRRFVVVDENNEISGRMLDRCVPRQRDILFGLDVVVGVNLLLGCELRDNCPR